MIAVFKPVGALLVGGTSVLLELNAKLAYAL
jgi:hypothetical protein